GGGTKIIVAFAPVAFTASSTVLKTGQPSCVVPPLPGVTPPTTMSTPNCLEYSEHPFAWNVPSRPVIPCTISRVFLSTRTLITSLPSQLRLRGPRRLSSLFPLGTSGRSPQ